MYFLIEDDDLLEKYSTVSDKVSADSKNNLIANLSIIKKFKKQNGAEVTELYDEEIPKVDANHTCLAVINLDSALKKDEIYYLRMFLKECKHIKKK